MQDEDNKCYQREHDPIQVMKRNFIEAGVATEEQLKIIDRQAEAGATGRHFFND
jgi:pyruvate dehydrogenase E1 component alpha subunit